MLKALDDLSESKTRKVKRIKNAVKSPNPAMK